MPVKKNGVCICVRMRVYVRAHAWAHAFERAFVPLKLAAHFWKPASNKLFLKVCTFYYFTRLEIWWKNYLYNTLLLACTYPSKIPGFSLEHYLCQDIPKEWNNIFPHLSLPRRKMWILWKRCFEINHTFSSQHCWNSARISCRTLYRQLGELCLVFSLSLASHALL